MGPWSSCSSRAGHKQIGTYQSEVAKGGCLEKNHTLSSRGTPDPSRRLAPGADTVPPTTWEGLRCLLLSWRPQLQPSSSHGAASTFLARPCSFQAPAGLCGLASASSLSTGRAGQALGKQSVCLSSLPAARGPQRCLRSKPLDCDSVPVPRTGRSKTLERNLVRKGHRDRPGLQRLGALPPWPHNTQQPSYSASWPRSACSPTPHSFLGWMLSMIQKFLQL